MVMAGMASRRLVARPLTDPGLTRRLVLLERRGATLSPAAEVLKGMLVDTLRSPALPAAG